MLIGDPRPPGLLVTHEPGPVRNAQRHRRGLAEMRAPGFDEEIELAAGGEMTLNYRTLFANGEWSREQVEQLMASAGDTNPNA